MSERKAWGKLDLSREWEREADNLAYLFAKELGQSRDQYSDGLPGFFSQSKSYRGRLYIPLLVQTPNDRLTLAMMCEIAGVANYIARLNEIKDWEGDSGKFKTPSIPYSTWANDGRVNLGRSVEDVRLSLAVDERGGNICDGISIAIHFPDILKRCFLNLPGSQHELEFAPYVRSWGGPLGFYFHLTSYAGPWFGSGVASRKIKTSH